MRGHRADDLDDCCAMWSDPAVTRYIGGKPSTRQQTWSRLLTYAGHWALLGFGYWVLEEKATGRFVGELGFADFKRDIAPSMQGVPELGFALASHAHGNGYASEAVRAALRWSDEHLAAERTVCLIDADNVVSQRVVQKAGYAPFDRVAFNEKPTVFLQRLRAGQR